MWTAAWTPWPTRTAGGNRAAVFCAACLAEPMGNSVSGQLVLFGQSILLGAAAGVVYDLLRALAPLHRGAGQCILPAAGRRAAALCPGAGGGRAAAVRPGRASGRCGAVFQPLCGSPAAGMGFLGGYIFLKCYKKVLVEKRRWQLTMEFKDAMDALSAALAAGYSMDHAMSEARKDLLLLYGRETLMTQELKDICTKLTLSRPLDELLKELGQRSGVEDILIFAQIYVTARRSGGNMVKIMKRTAGNIGEKMEVKREIRTMIAGKRMEAVCMMVVPLGILLYLNTLSPDFLQPLYQTLAGGIFMTISLLVYGVAVWWGFRIMRIQT